MKTIRLTVTDQDGTILDRTDLQVDDRTDTIAFRPLSPNGAERPDEQTLHIGR